jgi:hypothetical protein
MNDAQLVKILGLWKRRHPRAIRATQNTLD